MMTSEFEHYLISDLITMPDRDLAQKIELLIWYKCSVPQPNILKRFLEALRESESPDDFYKRAREIVHQSGCEFVPVEVPDRICLEPTPGQSPPGYIEITPAMLLEAELQEPK